MVTVVEGRVAVSRADTRANSSVSEAQPRGLQAAFVSAGERIDTAQGITQSPTRANASAATAWTQGKVILQSATLDEVAASFNRYSQRRLIAIDHGETPLRLSGVFSTDPDFVIRYLRERADIDVEESATQIRIIRAAAR